VGLRPTPGRIALYPTEFAWDTLVAHVQGPMARTVEDAGLMLAALAGPDDRDPTSLRGQRPGCVVDVYGTIIEGPRGSERDPTRMMSRWM
jgi:amidase